MVYDLHNHRDSLAWKLECKAAKSAFKIIQHICIPSITL
jgi:hypothetical protein